MFFVYNDLKKITALIDTDGGQENMSAESHGPCLVRTPASPHLLSLDVTWKLFGEEPPSPFRIKSHIERNRNKKIGNNMMS